MKALLEKRAALLPRIKELQKKFADTPKEWTPEDEANWKAIVAEYDALTEQIARAEYVVKVEQTMAARAEHQVIMVPGREDTRQRSPEEIEADRGMAFNTWARRDVIGRDLSDRHVEAARNIGFNLDAQAMTFGLSRMYDLACKENRALSSFILADGGALVPTTFQARFEQALLAYGGMLTVSEVMNTATGEPLEWPAADDTSNTGAQVGENALISTEANPTFKKFTLTSYDYTSKMIKVPNSLMRDSSIDLGAILGDMLGVRLGRILNTRCTTGTGAATIKGIVTSATAGVTTAASAAITIEEVLDLIESVDPAYRIGARFMFNSAIATYLRKLKSTSQYLWQPDVTAGTPGLLLGYPFTINQDMASTLTTTYITMLFGQLTAYKVRQVGGVVLKKLVERYAEYNQTAFVALASFDGGLLDAGTHPVKKMTQV